MMSVISDFLKGFTDVIIKTSKPIQTFKTLSDFATGVASAFYEKPIIGKKNQANRELLLSKIGNLSQAKGKELLVNMLPLGSLVNAKLKEEKK